ncbi:unnamed protein product [Caenorhabditis angaria]|uniref:Aquaporin n=1 Tax=Caenorhabditis angaria TaxID=860376 RepID=A0A9P1MY39_9PELO|nr:unnamed protein product [Caenorhabditis angaria]
MENFHNQLILPNIGEFLGSLFFAFLSCFIGEYQKSLGYPIFISISLFISRSIVQHCTPAHFNPAITLLQCIRQRISPILATSFIICQFFGLLFGVTFFRCLVSQTEFNDDIVFFDLSTENSKINRLQAFFLEVSLTLVLLHSFSQGNRDSSNFSSENFTFSASWGLIQLISMPFYGFSSNFTFLCVNFLTSCIFSPTTTPSFSLIYLNFFAMILAVFLAWLVDWLTSPKSPNTLQNGQTSDNKLV